MRNRRVDTIDTACRPLGDRIAGVVDVIGVVAGASDHGVGTKAAVQDIVSSIASQNVVQPVAGSVEITGPS